jgi:hypothetical protein
MAPEVEAAWQKAQTAWEAAGKPIPCHDPAYMAARIELAEAWAKADADRLKKETKKIDARR